MKADLLSRLKNISEQYDPIIEELRSLNGRKRPNWIISLFFLPFINLAQIRSLSTLIENGIQYFVLSFLPLFAAAVPYFALDLGENKMVWTFIAFGAGYIVTMLGSLIQMITLGHPNFHLDAYRVCKKKEYKLFETGFLYQDFSFTVLHDFVKNSFTVKDILEERFTQTIKESLQGLINQFQEEKNRYILEQEKLAVYLKQAEEAIQLYEDGLDDYDEDISRLEKILKYLS